MSCSVADFAAHMIDRTAAFGGLLVGRLRSTGSAIGVPGHFVDGAAHLLHGGTHVDDFALLTVGATAQAYLRVPIGVALGVIFLGEQLSSTVWIGLACVVIGVAAMTIPERPRAA